MVERVVHLGFEVRVELVLHDGRHVSAQVTRDEAEELELAAGPGRLRPAEPDDDLQWGCHASGSRRDRARPRSGSSPAATSARVTDSSTARRLARIGDPHALGAARRSPRTRPPPGRAPRTFASGPSTARITSASVISSGGPGQPVAAVGSPLALHEPVVAQLEQDVLEELERNPLGLGDPLALDRAGRRAERRARPPRGSRSRPWPRRASPDCRRAAGRSSRRATASRLGAHALAGRGEDVAEDIRDLVELRLPRDERRRDLDDRVAAVVGAADQPALEERAARGTRAGATRTPRRRSLASSPCP